METESTVPITPLSDVRDPCHNDDDDPIASLSVEADLIRLYAYSIGSNDPDPPRFSRDAPAQPSLSLSSLFKKICKLSSLRSVRVKTKQKKRKHGRKFSDLRASRRLARCRRERGATWPLRRISSRISVLFHIRCQSSDVVSLSLSFEVTRAAISPGFRAPRFSLCSFSAARRTADAKVALGRG